MSSLSHDPDVERFLTNFSHMNQKRNEETDDRFKSLERQLEEKKKQYESLPVKNKKPPPTVPKKSINLSGIRSTSINSTKQPSISSDHDFDIPLFNPIASKNSPNRPSPASQTQSISLNLDELYSSNTSRPRKNEPKPIKLEDVIQPNVRTDIKGFKGYQDPAHKTNDSMITKTYIPMPSKLNAVSASAAAKAPQLMKTKIDSSAAYKFWDDGKQEETSTKSNVTLTNTNTKPKPAPAPKPSGVYIPMPSKLNVLSATAAAKAPQLMKNKVDSSAGDRFWEGRKSSSDDADENTKLRNVYVPMPSKINAMSASAAAKAKPLAQTKIETTLNEKTSDLTQNYKFLTRNSDAFKQSTNQPKAPELKPKPKPVLKSKPDLSSLLNKPTSTFSNKVPDADRETEAFKQLNKLRASKPIIKPQEGETEAAMKLRQLRNKSSAPGFSPVPTTNISKPIPNPPNPSPPVNKPSDTMNTKVAIKNGVGFALPGLANIEKLNTVLLSRPASSPNLLRKSVTDTKVQEQVEDQKLTHMTKSRAKGPKRRLPKSVGGTPLSTPTSTIIEKPEETIKPMEQVPLRRIPPPIKKSSRVVSNSAIFI